VEIQHLRSIKELLGCSCLESAAEWWAGKYQFRFQLNKADRFRQGPIEISVGSVLIQHGFEYYGQSDDALMYCRFQRFFLSYVRWQYESGSGCRIGKRVECDLGFRCAVVSRRRSTHQSTLTLLAYIHAYYFLQR